jgi:hypothetical protein
VDLNAPDAPSAMNRDPAGHRDVLRIAPRTRPNGHSGMAVYCLKCNHGDVRLSHVQVASALTSKIHRVEVGDTPSLVRDLWAGTVHS